MELDVFEPASRRQLVAMVERALVVVAQDDRHVAARGVDVTLEAVELTYLRLGRTPQMVGVARVVRLFPDGNGVGALVLVMNQVPDADDLVTPLQDRRRRFEGRGTGGRSLQHPPQLRPLAVHVTAGDALDHGSPPPR